jgi:hypothetical protein
MEWSKAKQTARELAEYFVYYCGEGDDYVPLIEKLREAKTRASLLGSVMILLCYGELSLGEKMEGMNKKRLDNLSQFIQTGDIKLVSQFRSVLIANISTFELEKIYLQERYLIELLSC